MQCPLCGKPMEEQPNFDGLWICVDGKIVLNPDDGPPFIRKCRGKYLTDAGAAEFEAELNRLFVERN